MPDGNPYPNLIATTPRKPLRVFLAVEHRDDCWNEREFNFLSSNLRVAAALAESAYDFRLVLGDGPHHPNHGGVLLPDALRWIWRPEPLKENETAGDCPRSRRPNTAGTGSQGCGTLPGPASPVS